jgi:hypothetical protein
MAYRLWLRILSTPRQMWYIYALVYLTLGASLQMTAPYTRVARFAHDWQVISLYGFYLIPLSALLRGEPWHRQYVYALAAIAPIDVAGFALHTSLAYPYNFIDSLLGERNFTLVFVMLASWLPYAGNRVVEMLSEQVEILARHIGRDRAPWSHIRFEGKDTEELVSCKSDVQRSNHEDYR